MQAIGTVPTVRGRPRAQDLFSTHLQEIVFVLSAVTTVTKSIHIMRLIRPKHMCHKCTYRAKFKAWACMAILRPLNDGVLTPSMLSSDVRVHKVKVSEKG